MLHMNATISGDRVDVQWPSMEGQRWPIEVVAMPVRVGCIEIPYTFDRATLHFTQKSLNHRYVIMQSGTCITLTQHNHTRHFWQDNLTIIGQFPSIFIRVSRSTWPKKSGSTRVNLHWLRVAHARVAVGKMSVKGKNSSRVPRELTSTGYHGGYHGLSQHPEIAQ